VVGDVNFIGGVTYGGKSVISDLVNPILGQVNLASTAIRITTSGF
jgi:phage/plasmid-associated DNA primase